LKDENLALKLKLEEKEKLISNYEKVLEELKDENLNEKQRNKNFKDELDGKIKENYEKMEEIKKKDERIDELKRNLVKVENENIRFSRRIVLMTEDGKETDEKRKIFKQEMTLSQNLINEKSKNLKLKNEMLEAVKEKEKERNLNLSEKILLCQQKKEIDTLKEENNELKEEKEISSKKYKRLEEKLKGFEKEEKRTQVELTD